MENGKTRSTIKEAFLKRFSELVVLICGILFFFLIYKIQVLYAFVKTIASILMPIIVGLALAYLINPIMMYFEKIFLNSFQESIKEPKKRVHYSRLAAVCLSFVVVFLFVFILGSMVFPRIQENIMNLVRVLPYQVDHFIRWMDEQNVYFEDILDAFNKAGGGSNELSLDAVIGYLMKWIQNDMFDQIALLVNGVVGFINVVVDVFVGCVVAFYVLMSKETFKRQIKKVIYAFFSDENACMIIGVLKQSDRIFGGFISGKIVDSMIIGVLCFIGALILNLPYAALISVIIGVTNVIPFFGPYIGAVPSSVLVLLADPTKGIIFILFILALQQFDGNILGPRILGESTGLSPFWVIFSILLGGGLFGIVGMLIGVPTFGVVYYLIKSYINYRLEKKQIRIE